MSRAVLALGSNLGDRLGTLQAAVDLLAPAGVRVVALSAVYETAPVGGPEQPDYLNAVALADTDLAPGELLAVTQGIETGLGRERSQRWGARTVDIDIVAYDDLVSDDTRLTLPHPRAAERAFVLRPWLDVDPGAAVTAGRPIAALLAGLDASGVRLRSDLALRVPA